MRGLSSVRRHGLLAATERTVARSSRPATDALPEDPAEAVAALFLAHSRSLVGLARLLVDDVATAEDVVQDAFAATWRHWSGIRDPEAALPYLRTAVLNAARNRLRHRMRGGRVVSADGAAELVADPHDDVDALERRHVVLTALRTLPYRQRQVLVLRYYLDHTEEQVAALLGLSRGAVHQHAVRGSASLAARLAELARPRPSEEAT